MTVANIDIRANARQAIGEFDRLKAQAGGSMASLVTGAGNVQAALGGIAAAAGAVSFVGLVKGAIDSGDSLNKLAQRTGMSTESLSQWQHAAGMADVSTEDLNKGIRALNISIAEGLAGDKEKVALFKQLGITLRDTAGRAKGAEQVLMEMADAYQASADGAGKVAIGQELMGRAAEGMIPLLNGGSEAIRAMKAEAEALGLTISADFAAKAEEFNDSTARMFARVQGLALEMATELLPTLQALVGEMNNARDATGEAGDSIGTKIGRGVAVALQTVGVLSANLSFVAQGVGREIGAVAAQLAALFDFSKTSAQRTQMFTAISQAVREDAERARKELDETEKRILGIATPATAGPADVNRQRLTGLPEPKRTLSAPPSGSGGAESESAKLVRRIQERISATSEELRLGRELTDQEKFAAKVLADLAAAKGKLTAADRERIQGLLQESTAKAQALAVERSAYADALRIAQERQRQRNEEYAQGEDLARQAQETATQRMATGREMLEQIEFETTLLGMNTAEREKAVAMRELERQGIKEGSATWEEYAQKIRNAIDTRTAREKAVESAKAAADEWRKMGDDVYSGLTDSLYRAFESGKSFGRTFFDSLKNLGKTTAINIGVRLVTGGAGGWLQGLMGGGGTAAAGGSGGILSMLGNVGSIAGMFGGGGGGLLGGLGGAGGLMGALGTFGGGLSAGFGGLAGSIGGLFGAAGTGATLGGSLSAGMTALGAGNILGGLGTMAGALGPIGLGIAAISMMAKGGEKRSGATYRNGSVAHGPSGGEISGAGDLTRTTLAGINEALAAMGSTERVGDFISALESSKKGKGFAYAGGTLSNGRSFGQADEATGRMNRRGSMSPEAAAQAYAEEMQQATLQALQAADVPGQLGDYLRQLGDIDALTGGALKSAFDRVQKALGERQQLEARLADMTGTALDKLNKQREAERASIDATNQALLAQVHAQEDVNTALADLATAYSTEAAAMAQAIGARRTWADQLRDFARGMAMGTTSPRSLGQRERFARDEFNRTSGLAMGGDEAARGRLQGTAADALAALTGSAKTREQYAVGFASIQAALAMNAAAADAQSTLEEKQLAAMQSQVQALGILNETVLTFAQAMERYNQANGALQAAKAARQSADASYVAAPPPAAPDPWQQLLAEHPLYAQSIAVWRSIGWTVQDARRSIDSAGQPYTTFATGGSHTGGARLVGEEGPELEVTGPARIYSARQTRDLLAPRDDSALAGELRAMRHAQDSQQRTLEAIATRAAITAKALEELRIRGVQIRDADSKKVPKVQIA